MSAFDLLDNSFPHGTVDGYRQGCKTNHCPAPVSCTLVDRWARSDIRFHRLVAEGATGEELAAWLDAQHQAEVASDRPVRRKKPKKPKPAPKPRAREWSTDEVAMLRELHTNGKNDAQIGATIGRSIQSVWAKRQQLGLPAIGRTYKRTEHGTVSGYGRGCHGDDCPVVPSCGDVGRLYHRYRKKAAA